MGKKLIQGRPIVALVVLGLVASCHEPNDCARTASCPVTRRDAGSPKSKEATDAAKNAPDESIVVLDEGDAQTGDMVNGGSELDDGVAAETQVFEFPLPTLPLPGESDAAAMGPVAAGSDAGVIDSMQGSLNDHDASVAPDASSNPPELAEESDNANTIDAPYPDEASAEPPTETPQDDETTDDSPGSDAAMDYDSNDEAATDDADPLPPNDTEADDPATCVLDESLFDDGCVLAP